MTDNCICECYSKSFVYLPFSQLTYSKRGSYTYPLPPPPLKDSLIGLFPGNKCCIELFLEETTINEPCLELFLEEIIKNQVVSLLDIREPRTDQSHFHYLCMMDVTFHHFKFQYVFSDLSLCPFRMTPYDKPNDRRYVE